MNMSIILLINGPKMKYQNPGNMSFSGGKMSPIRQDWRTPPGGPGLKPDWD